VESCRGDTRKLWKTVNSLLEPPQQPPGLQLTADDFSDYFRNKIAGIRQATSTAPPPDIQPRLITPGFPAFTPATITEIQSILSHSPSKSSAADPIPTWLLKQLSDVFAPTICYLCNLSLQSGIFPASLKHATVLPRLKKPNLDP
jgi:hypothetical protein